MSKTKRIIAAITAAIITATSTSLMSVCADENGGSDFGFVSKSTTNKSDNIEAVESNVQLYEKLAQLLKQGDSLKYGEALYTTGTPDGEKWTKEFYEQRVEFYGEDLLSKYIVDGEFLRKSVESDMKGLLDKTENELDKYVDIINDYLMSNSIAGSAYAIKNDGVDKLLITYDGHIEKIKAYIAEIGIDESLVVFSQAHDMIVTKPATTTAVNISTTTTTSTKSVENGLTLLKGTKDMTINDVIELAKKGDELNWSDFDEYVGKDGWHGVGMYTHTCSFELGDGYVLYVGGNQPTQPETILLYHNDPKSGIDIRTDDVKEYITSSATPVSGNAENSTIKAIAEDIDKYMQSNSIAGFAYVHEEDGVEKIFISYFGALDKIQDYVAEKGINESLVVYQQSQDYTANTSMLEGDANCDGQLDLSDAVMIMQSLANPNKYGIDGTAEKHLTEQGQINGDMDGDGLTVGDAQAIQMKLLGIDDTDNSQSSENEKNNNEAVVSQDAGFGQMWNGKPVYSELYTVLSNNTDKDTVIAVSPQFKNNENYKYNGKTIAEYSEEVRSNNLLDEKLRQILKEGDELKYGELLCTTGTPDEIKWSQELYEQRVEFYGDKFLAKYIVNGKFLKDKVEADIADFSTEPHTALAEAIKAYKKAMIQETIEQLKKQNIKYDYSEASENLIINVTAEEFKDLFLENISCYYIASTSSDDGFVSARGTDM